MQPAIRFHTPAPRSVFRVSPRKSGSGQSTEAAEADRSYVSAVPETRANSGFGLRRCVPKKQTFELTLGRA